MKKIMTVILISLLFCFLTSCSTSVNSESDARRVLLQEYDELSECLLYLEDKTIEVKDLESIKSRLDTSFEKIELTIDYCVDDAVNTRYESTMEMYEKVEKLLNNLEESEEG